MAGRRKDGRRKGSGKWEKISQAYAIGPFSSRLDRKVKVEITRHKSGHRQFSVRIFQREIPKGTNYRFNGSEPVMVMALHRRLENAASDASLAGIQAKIQTDLKLEAIELAVRRAKVIFAPPLQEFRGVDFRL